MKFIPKVNCQYYIHGTGCCSNKNVKRSWFFGLIGPRYCMLANPKDWRIHCDFRVERSYVKVEYIPPLPKKSKPSGCRTIKRPWL